LAVPPSSTTLLEPRSCRPAVPHQKWRTTCCPYRAACRNWRGAGRGPSCHGRQLAGQLLGSAGRCCRQCPRPHAEAGLRQRRGHSRGVQRSSPARCSCPAQAWRAASRSRPPCWGPA
jgi:hypothetical protein